MARPLRIEEPELWHHVMNRGAGGQSVFLDDADREAFLTLVGDCAKRWALRTYALVLMTNHYHLFVHDVQGRLSRAMRHLNGVYTQRFNWRHGRDGTLFRGRYRSRVVQEEGYLAEVVRYIHLNPLTAGLVSRAEEYQWSTHRYYLAKQRPQWLSVGEILELFGDDDQATRQTFDDFVHEPIPEDVERQFSPQRWSSFLGDDRFVEEWRDRLIASRRPGRPEIPEERQLTGWTCDEVIQAVSDYFKVDVESICRGRRGSLNLPRQVAMLICIDNTAAPGMEIADTFSIRSTSVSSLGTFYRRQLTEDPVARDHLAAARKKLGMSG